MTAREFAEKYAGKKAKIVGHSAVYNKLTGRVVAYYDAFVIIELDYGYDKLSYGSIPVVAPDSVTHTLLRLLVQNLRAVLNDGPDDCFDCGAIGIETCKPDCPNRE